MSKEKEISPSKQRRKFTQEQKDKAVEDFVSGARSAKEIAKELDTDIKNIYNWKTAKEEKAKGVRVDELMGKGYSKEAAAQILNMELELELYKKKLAEEIIKVELLKKIQNPSQSENELTGLINTTRKLDQKRRRAK